MALSSSYRFGEQMAEAMGVLTDADPHCSETLVLFGTIGGMEIGDLTFTIWDAAVPALPVGGGAVARGTAAVAALGAGSRAEMADSLD